MTVTAAATSRRLPAPVERRTFRAFELPGVLGLSRASVTKLIASGDLASFSIGRCRFVATADLDDWLARRRGAAGQ